VDARGAIADLLDQASTGGVASAASAWVWHDGRVVADVGRGTTRADGGRPVTADTVFDVASLTKPFMAVLAARSISLGRARPDERVVEGHEATLEEVLSHRAGFQAWMPLYERVTDEAIAGGRGREIVVRAAREAPLAVRPAETTIYSDLGYIGLMCWLRSVWRRPLAAALEEQVTGPLGLTSVHFRPLGAGGRIERAQVPATEVSAQRGGLIQGIVHDDNAYAMGGIATHAGLFCTARDAGGLAVAAMEAYEAGGFLDRGTAAWSISPVAPGCRTPGWDVKSETGSSAGRLFGDRSFGHLGFTGCSIWADPEARLVVSLLTNRVHPSRDNERIRRFRPLFHDAVHDIAIAGRE
jgi:CubicO group peptidase (beta-lactamase class C family)